MSVPSAPGGGTANPGGNGDPTAPIVPGQGDPAPGGNPAPQTVSYESYQKALDEKKRAQDRARELEKEKKEREEQELRAKEDWKKIAENNQAELVQLQAKAAQAEAEKQRMEKISAFKGSLKGQLDPAYEVLVDLNQIPIDPITGKPDPASVQKYAQEFETKHGRLLDRGSVPRLPNGAPTAPPGGKLSKEEWDRLPLKDQRARLRDQFQK